MKVSNNQKPAPGDDGVSRETLNKWQRQDAKKMAEKPSRKTIRRIKSRNISVPRRPGAAGGPLPGRASPTTHRTSETKKDADWFALNDERPTGVRRFPRLTVVQRPLPRNARGSHARSHAFDRVRRHPRRLGHRRLELVGAVLAGTVLGRKIRVKLGARS